MGATDKIIAWVSEHGGSCNDAAEALGYSRSTALRARRKLDAEGGQPKAPVIELAPPVETADPTAPPLQFWGDELRLLARYREMCAGDGSWVAFAQLTRQLHTAREVYDRTLEANPREADGRTDEEIAAEVAELLRALPAGLRKVVRG